MSTLRLTISMSLDGFVAGPNQSEENPLGEGGMALHEWAFALDVWRESHGLDGGEANASSEVVRRGLRNIGAYVMGRNMFGGRGGWGPTPWQGWWGDDPPYHTPVFVVTHHAREPLVMQGGTTFHFVTDGIGSALAQAREAAGDQDVVLAGGANIAQQYVGAGLVDELSVSLVGVLLGDGERLFDNLAGSGVRLRCTEAIAAPGATHLTYVPAR